MCRRAVYSPALTDFVFVVENISKKFITGPEVIKQCLERKISMEDLGGARVHSEITVTPFLCQNEKECFSQIKKLISLIPGIMTLSQRKSSHISMH
jgi:acetyl-CoA carboxylase carboxyltransferase component